MHRDAQRHRDTETHRHTKTQTHRDRHRHTDTQRHNACKLQGLTTLVLDVPLKTVSVVCLEPVAGYWLIWLLTTSICYCQLDSAQSPKSHDIPSGDRQTELDQAVGLRVASGSVSTGPEGLQTPLPAGANEAGRPDQPPCCDLEWWRPKGLKVPEECGWTKRGWFGWAVGPGWWPSDDSCCAFLPFSWFG